MHSITTGDALAQMGRTAAEVTRAADDLDAIDSMIAERPDDETLALERAGLLAELHTRATVATAAADVAMVYLAEQESEHATRAEQTGRRRQALAWAAAVMLLVVAMTPTGRQFIATGISSWMPQ